MRTSFAVFAAALLVAKLVGQDGWPYSMDYGPSLMTTLKVGGAAGTTDKALVIRLGDRGAVAFDTELLRMSAAWSGGWLHLRGTAYDGAHGPMPQRRGRNLAATDAGPGWARNGSFDDPRSIPHGPLPRDWGQFGGYRLAGETVVIDYRIGAMQVQEHYALAAGDSGALLRTIELGPCANEQRAVVANVPAAVEVRDAKIGEDRRLVAMRWPQQATGAVVRDVTTGAWQSLSIGAPSAGDYLDASSGTGATIAFVPGLATAHDRTADGPALPILADGVGAGNDNDRERSVWFDRHKVDGEDTDHGRFLVDLQRVVDVSRVNTFTWHRGSRAVQRYALYASDRELAADVDDPEEAGWQRVARVNTRELGPADKHGVGIARAGGLGKFRYLLFDVRDGQALFSEIDVYAGEFKAAVDRDGGRSQQLAVWLRGDRGPTLSLEGTRIVLTVPAHEQSLRLQVALSPAAPDWSRATEQLAANVAAIPDEPAMTRWGEAITTRGQRGTDDGAFAVDTITIPFENPFGSRMRTAAFDFFADGRAAVTTWNGDVWVVSGIGDSLEDLRWRRFATGMFDPLGLRIVDDVVYVHGRDGLTRLFDRDGDGEADHYECFNNQVYITPAFHEFAFDLQTDTDGNFYFAKGAPVKSGGRGFMKIVPHHGTILKVDKSGASIETIATGLRAPNGIGLSPDGVITCGDNEGTFMPRCRLNWIEQPGFYAGVKDTSHRDPVPDQPDLPLCWMPMEVDNSSGGQVWVDGAGWPDLQGRLLHLSYGTCSVNLVLPERVDGRMQGGVVRLPADFSSSCMRGRFSPIDGQLYVVGLKGWQTSAARDGGFHRVRRTAAPLDVPTQLQTCDRGVYLSFDNELDAATASDPQSFGVQIWNYRYSSNYGSPEVSVLDPERQVERGKENRDDLTVTAASLSPDRRTVFLAIDGMRPVHQMKITWDLDSADGRLLRGELHTRSTPCAKIQDSRSSASPLVTLPDQCVTIACCC